MHVAFILLIDNIPLVNKLFKLEFNANTDILVPVDKWWLLYFELCYPE